MGSGGVSGGLKDLLRGRDYRSLVGGAYKNMARFDEAQRPLHSLRASHYREADTRPDHRQGEDLGFSPFPPHGITCSSEGSLLTMMTTLSLLELRCCCREVTER